MTRSGTLGLAVIAKDEEENLPQLLASVEGAFAFQCGQLAADAGMAPPENWKMRAYFACVQLYGLNLAYPSRLSVTAVAEKTVANYAARLGAMR
jgi:hypothetical protein